MFDDDDKPRNPISSHEVGMDLDALSVGELTERIQLLENEIQRLREAIDKRNATRTAADSVFKL